MLPRHAWFALAARLRPRAQLLVERLRAPLPPPARRVVVFGALAMLGLAGLGTAGTAVWVGTCGLAGCPSVEALRAWRPPEGGQVLDRDGVLLGRLATHRQVTVAMDEVPEVVRQAFVAVEDQRFLEHPGVDWWGAARAAWRNLTALEIREGSSTITMQAARSAFLRRYEGERSLNRKLLEVAYALRIERALSKDEILELYLNVIYLGDDTYGVEAASRHWFGRPVSELSLARAALLAGLPRAPALYDPRRNPERATARRDLVLDRMVEQGFVGEAEADSARAEPLGVSPDGWSPEVPDGWAAEVARRFADSVLGGRGDLPADLTIVTTFDARAQAAAERAVARAAGGRTALEVALVALDPATGALLAVAGGRQFTPAGFNRAFEARRQPGSAFKPFVYAAAMEAGLTTASLVDDAPVEVATSQQVWRPANSGGEYLGRVTLRHALARSANAAAVRVSQSVGMATVVATARRMGITSPLEPVPAAALGAYEVTPLELATAYAPLANGGSRVPSHFVTRIEDAGGRVLWEADLPAPTRALDPRDAFLTTSMLESAVDRGTGWSVRGRGVAGKTGTSNDGADAWFVGYTPDLVAAVWVGHDQRRAVPGASGGRLAAPVWAEFFDRGWQASPDEWVPPEGLVQVEIDAETGLLAGEHCPVLAWEWFKAGTEPEETCEEHDESVGWIGDAAQAVGNFFGDLFR